MAIRDHKPALDIIRNTDATVVKSNRGVAALVDPVWYRAQHPDIAAANIDPVQHFLRHGANEQRDPNAFFDSAWYAGRYPDVAASGLHPLQHYLQIGAAELRDPHPRFDAVYYASQHPEAVDNPLLYHLQVGQGQGYLVQNPHDIRDYLPSKCPALPLPRQLVVDVVIPVYRGQQQVRHCIAAVLTSKGRPLGQIIVVEDRSPDPALVGWLQQHAADGQIKLLRNRRSLGFAASANRGIQAAGDHDVVLLSSDMLVPEQPDDGVSDGSVSNGGMSDGWLRRLTAQAYAQTDIATVSPFSSTATICGYPDNAGGPLLSGTTVAQLDAACQQVNRGRSVDVPATTAYCMFIRRQALQDVGPFAPRPGPDTFGPGTFAPGAFGPGSDFCVRATAMGWRHRLACDVFVQHASPLGLAMLSDKPSTMPEAPVLEHQSAFSRRIAQHLVLDAVAPFRFAVTAGLLRNSGLPVILMVSHNLGGGVRRHIDSLVERCRDTARILLLEGTGRGVALSVPSLPNHPVLKLLSHQVDDLVMMLRSAGVSRVHIHHLVRIELDIRRLIHRLNVPFDVTVHDYYAICPQINLLPWPESLYCGEPDVAGCNACIAHNPGFHDAREILSWRRERAWQFQAAERVICPSNDVKARLQRHGIGDHTIVVPHEHTTASEWPIFLPQLAAAGHSRLRTSAQQPLRIALLGALANHKGSRAVAALAEAADPATLELHLIGYLEDTFPPAVVKLIKATGSYKEAELAGLLQKLQPHVVWLPSSAPETYSYTLSTAIDAGLPIVATRLGSFPERLSGRPYSWLVDDRASTADWLAVFGQVRRALQEPNGELPVQPRPLQPRPQPADFYRQDYLVTEQRSSPSSRRRVSRPLKPIIAMMPERFDDGTLTPCAYIRLLQPLDHPAVADGFTLELTDAGSVLDCRADIIVTQRHALPDVAVADAVAAHARRTGATLLFDLDDDLLNIPKSHPDAQELRPRGKVVRRMLHHADAVWVSTPGLAKQLSSIRQDATVIENALDERIWNRAPAPTPFQADPVRFLCMGTATHDDDFAMIAPALIRLKAEYGDRVAIDILGMTRQVDLPPGLNRIGPSKHGWQSYPGFVHWINTCQPAWHIGLAPLVDTPFNRSKSALKALDYAAMGMVVMASDMPVYRGSIADGPAGQLVPNTAAAWYQALAWMVRDQDLRRSIAAQTRAAFLARGSLISQAAVRRDALRQLLRVRQTVTAA